MFPAKMKCCLCGWRLHNFVDPIRISWLLTVIDGLPQTLGKIRSMCLFGNMKIMQANGVDVLQMHRSRIASMALSEEAHLLVSYITTRSYGFKRTINAGRLAMKSRHSIFGTWINCREKQTLKKRPKYSVRSLFVRHSRWVIDSRAADDCDRWMLTLHLFNMERLFVKKCAAQYVPFHHLHFPYDVHM